ncbi:MAG: hypothetical protein AAF417_00740 [Pseudomonadota bacterium]
MNEPRELQDARRLLARAESDFRSSEGLRALEDGLSLIEDVVLSDEDAFDAVAHNLLATYSDKICASIKQRIEADAALPEPELKQLFDVLLAFDAVELDLPSFVRPLKIEVVKRLIDLHYEGYPEEEKQRALKTLAGITGE